MPADQVHLQPEGRQGARETSDRFAMSLDRSAAELVWMLLADQLQPVKTRLTVFKNQLLE